MKKLKKLGFFLNPTYQPESKFYIFLGGGLKFHPLFKKSFFSFRFFHFFKRNSAKKLNQYIYTIHILHLVRFLCILELHQLNYD